MYNYNEACCLTKSNSGWPNSRTWKMSGESMHSYVVAMTSCEAMGYGYTSTNIHTITVGNSVLGVCFLIDYTIFSYRGS